MERSGGTWGCGAYGWGGKVLACGPVVPCSLLIGGAPAGGPEVQKDLGQELGLAVCILSRGSHWPHKGSGHYLLACTCKTGPRLGAPRIRIWGDPEGQGAPS